MRKGSLLFAVSLAMWLAWPEVSLWAEETYGRAEITVMHREQPLLFYKEVCEKEVVPEFIARLKEENPSIDAREMAEKITVQAVERAGRIVVYVAAEHAKTGVAQADMLGEMALLRFHAIDQAERIRSLEGTIEEAEEVRGAFEPVREEVAALKEHPGLRDAEKRKESLGNRVDSCKEEVAGAKLRYAELEAMLEVLSEKAAEARGSVSTGDVALLEQMARELAMQLDEPARKIHGKHLERLEVILKQKERDFAQKKALREKAMISEGELLDAEDALKLAKNEYELATLELEQASERLHRVRRELEDAKDRVARTGGVELGSIVAEKTVECHTEMAAIKVRMAALEQMIEESEEEAGEIGSLEAEVQERTAELTELGNRLKELDRNEYEIRRRIRETALVETEPSRYIRVAPAERIEAERAVDYSVIGEVKDPGSKSLVAETTVMKAIAAAGGFTEEADAARVIVLRGEGRPVPARPVPGARTPAVAKPSRVTGREVIDCEAILEGEEPDEFVIESGDIIVVPPRQLEAIEPAIPPQVIIR